MSDQHNQLDLLDALLAHEEAEMLGRTQHHLCDPEMRRIRKRTGKSPARVFQIKPR